MMKRLLLILSLTFSMTLMRAQLNLLHTFDMSASVTELSIEGNKYFAMDVADNQCELYNTDFSWWKTIDLPMPPGMYLYDIRYVSDDLFQTDGSVELAYICYAYDTVNLYYTYQLRVINEGGNLLLDVPGGYFCEVLPGGGSQRVFLVYVWDFSIWPYTVETRVYSLPGQASYLPGEAAALNGPLPFPNPASHLIRLPYSFPREGFQQGYIRITDQSGRSMGVHAVAEPSGVLSLDIRSYAAGTYYYQLQSDNYSGRVSRFIVGK